MKHRAGRGRWWYLAGLASAITGAAWGVVLAAWRRKRYARTDGEQGVSPVHHSWDPFYPEPALEGLAEEHQPGEIAVTGPASPAAQSPETSSERSGGGSLRWPLLVALGAILAGFTVIALLGGQRPRTQAKVAPGGDADRGRQAIQSWGCGSCHTIQGIPGAESKVGPRLDQMGQQTYIAGMLPNTPNNLIRWIMDPQEIMPGNVMPDTGVTEPTARDMAAYLYSIKERN